MQASLPPDLELAFTTFLTPLYEKQPANHLPGLFKLPKSILPSNRGQGTQDDKNLHDHLFAHDFGMQNRHIAVMDGEVGSLVHHVTPFLRARHGR